MSNIKLVNVTKKFGEKSGIENLSLEISDGEFVVLLGPSGSGKTEILRMIAGLDEIDMGELYINDVVSNDLQPKDRNIAMVFQNHQLLPHLNVYDNIAFGLKLRKMSASEINVKIKEVARILNIEDCLQQKPKSISSIERQRVTIARAIVREPNACLFDDSLSSLDADLTKRVRSELIKIQYRTKSTFVFATRDQIDALSMATKLVVMNEGKIEQIGTPREIYANPRTAFVATYVGSPEINLASATLASEGEDVFVEMLGIKIKLPAGKVAKFANIGEYLNTQKGLTVAIRPENIQVCEDEGNLVAKIDSVEEVGMYKTITLKLAEKTINDWNVTVSSDNQYEIDKPLNLKIDGENLLIFDRESEITVFND